MSLGLSQDMTSGSEQRHILRFAVPMLAGNLLQQMYNVADTMIVGKFLGPNSLAAVGATGSITFFFYTICLGLATGAGIVISQYFGSGQKNKVKTAIFNSAVLTAIFGIIISIVSVFLARPILQLLNTPDNLLAQSTGYMKIAVGGTIAVAAYNWINSIMRSLGDSKTPLIFLGIASVLNVGLDLLFVVVFKWGVQGAAWATITAQSISAIASIVYAFCKNNDIKLQRKHFVLYSNMLKKCVYTGIPIALQNGMISISMIALQRVTNSFGETVMAAYTVTMRIEQLVQQPFSSLNVALSTFTGQNTGAGDEKRVIKGYHVGVKIASILAIIMMLVFIIFGKYLVGFFVNGEKVIEIGATALAINSCFYVALGLIHTTRGFLNGTGDTGYAAINGLVEVVCRIVFSLILTRIAFIGFWGIWWTTCITWLATAMFSVIRYKQGKWKLKSCV